MSVVIRKYLDIVNFFFDLQIQLLLAPLCPPFNSKTMIEKGGKSRHFIVMVLSLSSEVKCATSHLEEST